MKPLHKGIALAVIHVLLVASLGGKLLYDRAVRPRVWVRTVSYDPNLPIRGRYAVMQLVVKAPPMPGSNSQETKPFVGQWLRYGQHARLEVSDGELTAVPDARGSVAYGYIFSGDGPEAVLNERVAFFLPEHVPDPTRRRAGRELWAEVTVPRKGPPRPIRLAYKENGRFTPLELR